MRETAGLGAMHGLSVTALTLRGFQTLAGD